MRVAKRGRSGYGGAEESLFLPLFSASPAAASVRLESQGGQSAGVRGQCRREWLSPQRTDTAPLKVTSSPRTPSLDSGSLTVLASLGGGWGLRP